MRYWLLKSEPHKYSWTKMLSDGRTHWDGVRNFQAANNLKAMVKGDQAFFYHSNEGLEIVGIIEIVREAYPDPGDASGRFVMVDVSPVKPLPKAVTLKDIKAEPRLSDLALVRQSRLSVVPIGDNEWSLICQMASLTS